MLCKIQPHIGRLEKYKNVRQTQTNYIQSEQTGGKLHVEPSSDAAGTCARDVQRQRISYQHIHFTEAR